MIIIRISDSQSKWPLTSCSGWLHHFCYVEACFWQYKPASGNILLVNVTYPAGKRVYSVETPVRKRCIKQHARRSYRAFSSTITKDSLTSTKVIYELSKKIKREMQEMSSQSFLFIAE